MIHYYYSTRLTRNTVVVSLNTEISMGGDQRKWLATELERLRDEPGKTIFVQYHVPAYGSVKAFSQGAPQRQYWVPLFEKFQVDLVAESDHHRLKRTVPIFQDKHNPECGIIYIGDGGLGVPQRTVDPSRWYLQPPGIATRDCHQGLPPGIATRDCHQGLPPGIATRDCHVHVIEFSEDVISARAIGLDRETLDEFVIESKQLATTP